jgi:ABC-type oligopeptide transport system ATPase subunit
MTAMMPILEDSKERPVAVIGETGSGKTFNTELF